MEVLAGPFVIVALVVALGGAAKLVAPEPTSSALRALSLPGSVLLVRSMGVAELVLGAAAVGYGGRVLSSIVAVAYVLFAAFVVAALRRGSVSSCGCFGQARTPPSMLHVVVNLAASGIAAAAGVSRVPGILETVDAQPAGGAVFVALVAIGVYMVHALLTVVPAVAEAANRAAPTRAVEFRLIGPVPVDSPQRRGDR